MVTISEGAFAKVNLTLDVLDKREDGYHNIKSVMQTISLHDDVTVDIGTNAPWQVHCYREVLDETDRENPTTTLVTEGYPAERGKPRLEGGKGLLRGDEASRGRPGDLHQQAHSDAGGLGGGSADAAAVLRVLNKHYGHPLSMPALCELGSTIGSDVPFCVMQGTVLVEGVGNKLTKLSDAPEMYFAVCKPEFSVSTPELYRKLDETFIEKRPDHKAMISNLQKGELLGIGGSMCNVFEPIVLKEHFDINYIRSMMITYGAYGAQMTGSARRCSEFTTRSSTRPLRARC